MQKIGFPEKDLVQKSFLLRKLDFPPSIKMTKKSLLRWIALSIGIVSENESRSSGLSVLDSLFYLLFVKKIPATVQEISALVEKRSGKKISSRLIYYHLSYLSEIGLIRKTKNGFVFNYSPSADVNDIKAGLHHNLKSELEAIVEQVSLALEELSHSYNK